MIGSRPVLVQGQSFLLKVELLRGSLAFLGRDLAGTRQLFVQHIALICGYGFNPVLALVARSWSAALVLESRRQCRRSWSRFTTTSSLLWLLFSSDFGTAAPAPISFWTPGAGQLPGRFIMRKKDCFQKAKP